MHRHLVIAILLLCTLLAASACGSDSKPDVCSKRDDLKKSVDSLLSVNPVSDGTAEVRSRLTDVQDATTELAKAAGDEFDAGDRRVQDQHSRRSRPMSRDSPDRTRRAR